MTTRIRDLSALNLTEFSDLILRLNNSAVELPPRAHQANVIDMLSDLIRFDAAWLNSSAHRDGTAGHSFIQAVFRSRYLSNACMDLSWPLPDCLTPPNGTVPSAPP